MVTASVTLYLPSAEAQNPPLKISDEGSLQGLPVFELDCSGTGISCSHSGITGTIAVDKADFSNDGDTAGANRTLGNNDNFDLGLETGGITRLHVEGDGVGASAGNVGIGTNSPLGLLHVNEGNVILDVNETDGNKLYLGGTTSSASISTKDGNDWIKLNASYSVAVDTANFQVDANNIQFGDLVYKDQATNTYNPTSSNNKTEFFVGQSFTEEIVLNGRARNVTQFRLNRSVNSSIGDLLDISEYGVSRLLIDSLGNVGIGTTTPARELDVSGDGSISGKMVVGLDNAGNVLDPSFQAEIFEVINGNLKVSQGTESSAYTFFMGDLSGGGPRLALGTRSDPDLYFTLGAYGNLMNLNQVSDLVFRFSNAEKVRFTTDGKVGIGTSTPTSKLEVAGDVKIDNGATSCIMIRDTDDAGWTECFTLNGILLCTTDADGICDGS